MGWRGVGVLGRSGGGVVRWWQRRSRGRTADAILDSPHDAWLPRWLAIIVLHQRHAEAHSTLLLTALAPRRWIAVDQRVLVYVGVVNRARPLDRVCVVGDHGELVSSRMGGREWVVESDRERKGHNCVGVRAHSFAAK